jgi:L-rhamnose-H+ transport protein
MKFSRAWRWENTWLVYATFALFIIPLLLAAWAVPHPVAFYLSLPGRDFILPLLFGFGWGIAQVTFGLAITQVGMAMAFAIVIGLSALLGSVVPLVVFHRDAFSGQLGAVWLISTAFLAVGLVLYARAGHARDMDASALPSSKRGFRNGLLLSIFTGCFGSMINMGYVFGGKIADRATNLGISAERATFCVWAVVLTAGYLPNLVYTFHLLRRDRSARLFLARCLPEGFLAFAAAVLWLFGMLGYGIGASVMGRYGNSIGFAVCMTVLLLWSSGLGISTGEWRAAAASVKTRMRFGLAFVATSMLTLGIGSLRY